MDFENIIKVLDVRCAGKAIRGESDEFLSVTPENWLEVAGILQNDADLTFDSLMCLTGYDNGAGETLGVAYNFHSMSKLHKLEIRIEVNRENPEIPSVASQWRAADWHEREAFDLYGIVFSGHPEMKRILLPDDWEGHPLRKDYETPEYYNGIKIPKDKSNWE